MTALNDQISPSELSKELVGQVAEAFARQVGYEPGGDLEGIVHKLGGEIRLCSFEELNESGSVEVRGKGEFTIYLPGYTGRLRDRFTIAHELGHYVLHSDLGERRLRVAREGSNRAEWEANWFAAAFLMPEAEFKKRMAWSSEKLASHFNVSPAAVEVRKASFEGQSSSD